MTQALQPQLQHKPRLVLVEPTSAFRDLHDYLVGPGNDVVHPIKNLDELVTQRLGFMDWSKRCFVVEQGTRITAVNYSHATSPAIPVGTSWKALPGNIDDVLAATSKQKKKPATVLTLYSIYNTRDDLGQPYKGAARALIFLLHETFAGAANAPIHTTLSPFREFRKWIGSAPESASGEPQSKHQLFIHGSLDDKRRLVAEYMRAANREDRNLVQNFHLGNGALVGAIQFNASQKTDDATKGMGVMINYRYSRDPMRLEDNRRLRAAGLIPCDHHLAPYFR